MRNTYQITFYKCSYSRPTPLSETPSTSLLVDGDGDFKEDLTRAARQLLGDPSATAGDFGLVDGGVRENSSNAAVDSWQFGITVDGLLISDAPPWYSPMTPPVITWNDLQRAQEALGEPQISEVTLNLEPHGGGFPADAMPAAYWLLQNAPSLGLAIYSLITQRRTARYTGKPKKAKRHIRAIAQDWTNRGIDQSLVMESWLEKSSDWSAQTLAKQLAVEQDMAEAILYHTGRERGPDGLWRIASSGKGQRRRKKWEQFISTMQSGADT